MDVNRFFHTLFIDSLGLPSFGLEGQYRDLVKLIERRTLPTFSDMVPAKYMTYLDLADRSKIIKKDYHSRGVEYYIDDPMLDKFNLPILGVERVRYNNVSGVDPYDPDSTAYYNSLITSRQNLTLEGLLMGSEYTYNRTLADNATPFKPYKEYRGGRILYLMNWGYHGLVEIEICSCGSTGKEWIKNGWTFCNNSVPNPFQIVLVHVIFSYCNKRRPRGIPGVILILSSSYCRS